MIENILAIIGLLAFLCLCNFFETTRDNKISRALFKHVQWCVTQTPQELFFRILCTQKDIETDYILSKENDLDSIVEILQKHQEYLANQYWKEDLVSNKTILKLENHEYYFKSLFYYLDKNVLNNYFFGYEHPMYIKISEKRYGAWSDPSFETHNSITEHGIAYNKLFYIVCRFCEENAAIKGIFNSPMSPRIKETLDEQSIIIFH